MNMIKQPVFLVGAERSGSTVLRLMLDHHPEISFREEFEFAVDQMDDNGRVPDPADYRRWLLENRIFRASGFTIDPSLPYPALVNSFLKQKQLRDGKPFIGATVHRHFNRLRFIWPDARFIYLVRDGRDVARSNIGMGWAGNVWTGVERWIEAEILWEDMKPQIKPRDRMEVVYEKLILDPEGVLAGICSFIGVAWSPAMMDYTRTTRYQRPDPSLVYQWRKKLSDREIRLLEGRISPLLERRDYPLSGLPPAAPGPWTIRRLMWQDRIARFRFRIRRYGLGVSLLDFLARRLGMQAAAAGIRRRIDAADQARLR